jgi:tRNA A37 threonylcarbamoyladenosine synthetase subunit TsaC/SUA5/YrdC
MDFLWSRGSFTLILEGKNHVNHLYKLDGKIALRIPSLSNLRVLVDKTGALSATSANPSGVEYKSDSDHIINSFKDLVQYFILSDIQNSASSVIIDLTQKKPSLLRGNFDMSLLASF